MLNIVIPMAGEGSRFKIEGYELPKPFIDINGKMMIERVLDSIYYPNSHYTLIIQKEFENNYRDYLDIIAKEYGVAFISVDELTQGACCTALAAHEVINNSLPVVFIDSDNIFDLQVINDFLSFAMSENNIDGALLTVNSSEDCFSYAKVENNYVVETKEKEVISNHAITGVYFFKNGKDFCTSAIDLMIYGKKTRNEYYMSNVFNRAIQHYDKKIKVFDIDMNKWHCVGTPKQLEIFLEGIIKN